MSNSDSEDENFIRYGTPLEPYEEDEIPSKRKYQQQPDQYAVDDHGRRRFHGAFTGGFSAGYMNSVGTPEGWTPTAFKSSRVDKAQISSQRPEDFMDEEDRGEFGIAPRQVQMRSNFSGQKRSRPSQFHEGTIPGEPVLQQLVQAVHETAAVRMLCAMGWRPGQGTGERLSVKQKKQATEQHKVYGCYVPPELRQNSETQEDEDNSDLEIDYETLFAPEDYEPYILERKSDRFGLGYSGLSRHSVLGNLVGEYGSDAGSTTSRLVMQDKGKRVSIRGQAFGVGAFEAEDDDIYATEDMSHYDFAIGKPEKQKIIKAKEKNGNVLEGFVRSKKPLPSVPSYPAPALPRDYRPAPAGYRRSRFEPTQLPGRDQGLGRHELTAQARGALLGETPIQRPATAQETTGPTPSSTPQPQITTATSRPIGTDLTVQKPDYISIKDSGKELVKVFRPFASDPKKQSRYEQFLKGVVVEADEGDRLREWERNRELIEFEQAAKLYKPLSGVMEDRFTHASEPDDALNPLTAVARSSTGYGLATSEQIEAAKGGLYGAVTRVEIQWRPEALVCKRFNVPQPGGANTEEKHQERPKISYSVFSYMESSVHDRDSFAKEQVAFSGSKSLNREPVKIDTRPVTVTSTSNKTEIVGAPKRMTVAELFLKESEQNKNEGVQVTETINKFDKIDLYKSIFLSDSEDEDVGQTKNNDRDFADAPKNLERNNSPPRGIFANIDFHEINSWKRPDKDVHEQKPKDADGQTKVDKVENVPAPDETYGPKIPDNFKPNLASQTCKQDVTLEIDSSSSSDCWVDANEVKKKKKKKFKKHKSKHKKSKHSKRKKKDR